MSLVHRPTGYKGTSHPLIVRNEIAKVQHNGRTYKLLEVETHDGLPYTCIRLYNAKGKFIKQFLFEPVLKDWLRNALTSS